nr:MAG TPA: hypothetical protein [Caudoviricetes sp.]
MENLIKAINLLKTSYSVEKEYTRGGCWNFAEALRLLHNHKDGLVVYDQINGHAYYTYDWENFFDITGVHKFDKERLSKFMYGEDLTFIKPENWCSGLKNNGNWELSIIDNDGVIKNLIRFDTYESVKFFLTKIDKEIFDSHSIALYDYKQDHYIVCIDENSWKKL